MARTIWDLTAGNEFFLIETGRRCKVVSPTEDGGGLLGVYVDGDLVGAQDFIFAEEIRFD